MQADFVIRLLQAAQRRGIDTAIETTGYCEWNVLEAACRNANQLFYDIKSLDPEKHRRETGVDNELILDNLHKLCRHFPNTPVTVRTPVVPGFNDTPDDMRAIRGFFETLPRSVEFELLPYHRFGESKYRQLGKQYSLKDIEPPLQEHMMDLKCWSSAQEPP